MHILLTNDDGIFTPSIAAMYKQLCKIATVTVVAPSQGQSGASHSITLSPITCDKIDITGKFTGYSVQGSPVDCIKLGILELCPEPVDLVVSGALSVTSDREHLERFLQWVNNWKPERKYQLISMFAFLRRDYPSEGLWDIVGFE